MTPMVAPGRSGGSRFMAAFAGAHPWFGADEIFVPRRVLYHHTDRQYWRRAAQRFSLRRRRWPEFRLRLRRAFARWKVRSRDLLRPAIRPARRARGARF